MHIPEMNDWRSENRFTDIVIKVDGKEFNCHRVALASASEYFNIMLGGSFSESRAGTVTMQDIKADAFEAILQYIYTGEVDITTENVYHLLKVADYLRLKSQLEKDCADFIEKNLPVQYMLDAATFVYMSERNVLLYHIINYISFHLKDFSETVEFLELPFEVVKMIVDWYILEEEIVIKATIRWINHERGDRWQCFSQLSRLGMLAGLPPTEIEFIARSFIPDEISSQDTVSYLRSLKEINIKESLTVYYKTNISRNMFRISIGHTINCNIMEESPKRAVVKRVVFDKSRIYTFKFAPRYVPNSRHGTLQFFSHTSDGKKLRNLELPARFTNRLHTYFTYRDSTHIGGLPNINRIYICIAYEGFMWEYYCGTNIWRRIELMNEERIMPTMATCRTSDRVYLVCSEENRGPYRVRALDGRTHEWTVPPKSNHTSTSPKSPAVCTFRGELYIYNRDYSRYEIYEPSTEKWRVSKPNPYMSVTASEHVTPYGDELWLFSTSTKPFEGDEETASIVHIYKPESNSWRKYPLIRAAIKKCGSIHRCLGFIDAIVF